MEVDSREYKENGTNNNAVDDSSTTTTQKAPKAPKKATGSLTKKKNNTKEKTSKHKRANSRGASPRNKEGDIEEEKERRSLEYTRKPAACDESEPFCKQHERKKSWDADVTPESVKKVKDEERRLERRSSRNFEALVLAEGGSPVSMRRKPTERKGLKTSSLAVKSKVSQSHHYFVLRIEEARNLRKADRLLGKADSYCTFDIIPSGIIGARTSTIRRSLNPRWNEQFVGHRYFGMDGEPKPKTFTITVMNYKSLSSDEFLGKAVIPYTDSVDSWFPLEGDLAQGELRVLLRFYDSEKGKELAQIPPKFGTDIEKLCAAWEEAVTEMNKDCTVIIPTWDVPCFFNIDKVWTLFQWAVSKDNTELVTHLAKLKCNIDARDHTGNTALHIAAKRKLQKQINFLIRLGVDRGVENYLGGKDYKAMLRMFQEDEEDGSYIMM